MLEWSSSKTFSISDDDDIGRRDIYPSSLYSITDPDNFVFVYC